MRTRRDIKLSIISLTALLVVAFVVTRTSFGDDNVRILERYGLQTDGSGLRRSVFFDDLVLTDQGFKQVAETLVRMKTIREVRFDKTPIKPIFSDELPKLNEVVALTFSKVELDAALFRAAAKLEKLESITVYDCEFVGDVISEIRECKKLRSLLFTQCDGLQGDVFTPFAHLKNLEHLAIKGSPKVTNEGLAALRHYPAIEGLFLDGTSVDDEVFSAVENLSTLTRLSLTKTKVTRQQLEIFRVNHPKIKIYPSAPQVRREGSERAMSYPSQKTLFD